MTAVAITSVAMFCDLGIGNGLLTRLAVAFGNEDYAAMRSDIASAYVTLSIVSLVLFVIFACALGFAIVGGVKYGSSNISLETVSIVAASLISFLLGMPASVIQRVMYACQQVWLSNIWQIVASVLSVMLCLSAIQLNLKPWGVVLAYSLPPIAMMVLSALWYFCNHPRLCPTFSDINAASARSLLALGSRFLALSVLTAISLNADNLIIASKAGAEAVTHYAVPAKLGSILGLIITSLYLPLWTANGEALARGDYVWVRTSARRMSLLGAAVVGVSGILMAIFGENIVSLWMGRTFSGQQTILSLISGLSVAMAIASPYNMVLNSLSAVKPQIRAWAVFLICTIVAKVVFVSPGSVWVVPAITLIGYVLIILPLVYIEANKLTRIKRNATMHNL